MSEQQLTTETTVDWVATAGNELVPGVKAEILPYQEAPPEKQQNIQKLLSEIDMNDTHRSFFSASRRRSS